MRAVRARRHLPALLALVACAGAAGAPRAARAATACPLPPGVAASVADIDGRARLEWIDLHLATTAHHAQLWKWGWGGGIVVMTFANLIPVPFVKPENRIDWYTSSASTAVGIVPLLIAPLEVIDQSRAVRARLVVAPATGRDVCAELAFAESALERSAKNQADGQRWWLHAGNVAVNAGVGLFLGLGFHHWLAGAYNFALGTAIGEAIILTQPTGSIGDLDRYRGGALDGLPAPVGVGYGGRF